MNKVSDVTGGTGELLFRTITVDFDQYVVKVRVNQRNEFVDIVQISLNKSFLSLKQKVASRGAHRVSDLYEE